jgi:hypothetical protein
MYIIPYGRLSLDLVFSGHYVSGNKAALRLFFKKVLNFGAKSYHALTSS